MSTGSDIGGVFGSLGSGVATFGGPIGAAAGAGFSVLGGLIGLGAKIRQRKREEEQQRKLLEEAQRRELAMEGQQTAEAAGQKTDRPQQAQIEAQKPEAQVQVKQQTAKPGPVEPDQQNTQSMAQQQLLSPELQQMLAGLRPGGGGFYAT